MYSKHSIQQKIIFFIISLLSISLFNPAIAARKNVGNCAVMCHNPRTEKIALPQMPPRVPIPDDVFMKKAMMDYYQPKGN